jgi:NAD(P)-dependent dehydrogenase (short-subunit alcohol dehydrogenase family)
MSQRAWFITGVSSGFGREMREQLLPRGDRVAGIVRKPDAVGDLRATYGDQLWIEQLDVTHLTEIRGVVDKAFSDLGRIDVAINNAGYGLRGAAEEATDDPCGRVSGVRSGELCHRCDLTTWAVDGGLSARFAT